MAHKVFNEEKYQKNRKVLNYIGMGIVILSIVIGGLVMFLGYKLASNLTSSMGSSSVSSNDKKVVLYDGTVVQTPKTKAELDNAYAKVDKQYPDTDSSENTSDKWKLKTAYESYIFFEDSDSRSASSRESFSQIPNIIIKISSFFPGFIIMIIGFGIGSKILVFANGRGILGFFAQSVVPVAQDTIDEMAPTVGKATGTIIDAASPAVGRALDTSAPSIGNIVSEIKKALSKDSSKDKK